MTALLITLATPAGTPPTRDVVGYWTAPTRRPPSAPERDRLGPLASELPFVVG